MPNKIRLISCFIISFLGLSVTNQLFAEPDLSNHCLSVELTIHNKTKKSFYLPFQSNSSSENIQSSTPVKPQETIIIQTVVKKIEAIGYLSFSIDLGQGKSVHVMDPFTTYQGVFSVLPCEGSEDLRVTVNSRKMNDQGICLFVNAADISINESQPESSVTQG